MLSPIHSLEKNVNKNVVAEQVPNYSRKLCSLELNATAVSETAA